MTDPAYHKPTWAELSKQRWGPSLRHDLPPIVVDGPHRDPVSNTEKNSEGENTETEASRE